MEKTHFKTLELNDDMRFHRIEWFLQRVGRICMFLFLATAVLGFFGAGLFSTQTAKNAHFEIEYERFARVQKDTAFEIRLLPFSEPKKQRSIRLNNDFLKNAKIERITPEPSQVQGGASGHTFFFESESDGSMSVFFQYRPQKPGKNEILMHSDAAEAAVSITQFVYP